MADNKLVWASSPNYKAEAWSLSCLVSEHVSMAADQAADTATAGSAVINDEYLSVSSRGSVTGTAEDVAVDPVITTATRSKRKRGNPWSENEHRQFLQGLQVHGKGKWKKISRDFVKTRNPVQVASHAQKFFDRHNSSKPKKRKSINDITSLPAVETLIRPHIYTHPPCSSSSSSSSSMYELPPLPDMIYNSQTHHIFGNHLVPPPTTHLVPARLTDQEDKMQLHFHENYRTPMLPPQPSLMWHDPVITFPTHHVGSMMEAQFPPHQPPIIDHLSVPTLMEGDYYSMDMSILEDLLPPL